MRRAEASWLVALVLAAAGVLWWRWVGYQGHDDASYAAAALDWAGGEPPVGRTHWSLRYTLVLPIAAVIGLSGVSVAALATVNMAAYLAFLGVSYAAARHWFGWPAAAMLMGIGVLLPEFPVQATYANPDLLEMAFVMGSFWVFLLARARGGTTGLLLLSGALAGFGFLTRETTLSLLLTFGLIWLVRPGIGRLRFAWMALGFLAVVGAETTYLGVRTGDPLYRVHISATHDRVDRGAKQEQAESAGRALDSEGNIAGGPIASPLLAVFASQKYGLLFLLAVPAYVVLRRGWGAGVPLSPAQASVVDCMALGALVSFLFVALNAGILYIVPRYFIVSAAMAAVPLAVLAGGWVVRPGLPRAAAVLAMVAFASSSALLLYLENTRPLLAEERLLRFAAEQPAPLHVDPALGRRMRYLALADGVERQVTTAPPGPGDLVGAVDGFAWQECLKQPVCRERARVAGFVPAADWAVVERFEPPVRAIAGPLRALGIAPLVPPDILRKVQQPGAGALVYRVPG